MELRYRKQLAWIVPLIIGILILPTYWWFFVRDYVVYQNPNGYKYMRSAMRDMDAHGLSSSALLDIYKIIDRNRFENKPPTQEEWARLIGYAQSADAITASESLHLLWLTANSASRQQEGMQAAYFVLKERKIPDKGAEFVVKSTALNALRRLHAPDWRKYAQEFSRSTDQKVAEFASELLQKGEYTSR